MSISQLFGLVPEASGQNDEIGAVTGKRIFVALRPPAIPENRFLSYATITNVLDVASLDDRVVVLFSDTQEQIDIVRVIAQNQRAVGIYAVHIDGLPGAPDSVAFKDAVFGLNVVSHAVFLSELALELEIQEQRDASQPTRKIDKEISQVTRSDGSIKEAEIGVIDVSSLSED